MAQPVEMSTFTKDPEDTNVVDSSMSVETATLAIQGEKAVVSTVYGPVHVTICGDRSKTAIVTYHDIGLNHSTCFQGIFLCAGPTSHLIQNFCVYHIDAPGHEEGATEVPAELLPVTADKLADQVEAVINHFELPEVLGMGVGFGGYVLMKYALKHRKKMPALLLVSPYASRPGWTEWANLKGAINQLWFRGLTNWVREYMVSRLVHQGVMNTSHGFAQAFRREIEARPSGVLCQYLMAALRRESMVDQVKDLKSRVLLILGGRSPFRAEGLDLNVVIARHASLIEVDGHGTVVTEESPQEVIGPLELFLQGMQHEGFGM
mmetsp:Transcript_16045/g.22139  ORF Transcript_16045/g.22139 Transcript_16045/m.22139 type:complete len:320 (-) Transcript_16045:356-1315(-)|eukprot:CAMPEP_0196582150 /NCGR_PEP_ID=MMETSP1081-20130531/37673_1 /TAXON_ID=36882 /ORGANISM="Pyramimonas amylifera, Strain CCMP720" /LENGTH=319 /DNA_ID=CAMNT_0041902635 /DNA_START=87 /DNA_END=1046 /DNA_ORIENTATION=+